jgi:hypothetical protein
MIHHTCPECQHPVELPDELAGRSIRCPFCQGLLSVPSTAVTSAPTPHSPPILASSSGPSDQQLPSENADLAAGCKAVEALAQLLGKPAVPSPRTKPYNLLRTILLLGGLPVVVCALTWTLVGSIFWFLAGGLATVFGGFALLGVVGERKSLSLSKTDLSLIFAYAILLEAVWWWGGLNVSTSDVYVDNFSNRPLHVEVDGSDWLTWEPGSSAPPRRLRRGRHHLVVRAGKGGEVLDERNEMVEGMDRAYVFNLLGAEKYYRGSVLYGRTINFGDSSPDEIRDVWFKPDVDFLFKPPPESITVSARSSLFLSNERTYLTRGAPPQR